jgi:hypothetical protein
MRFDQLARTREPGEIHESWNDDRTAAADHFRCDLQALQSSHMVPNAVSWEDLPLQKCKKCLIFLVSPVGIEPTTY